MTKPKPRMLIQTKATPRIFQIQKDQKETGVMLEERTSPGQDGYIGYLKTQKDQLLLDSFKDIRGSVYIKWS
jgi:hypothetical protein